MSRVTVILTGYSDPSAESRICQLERDRGMTVIVVGIGYLANTASLHNLASHPSASYAIPFDNFPELIVSAPYISSLISDVPPLFQMDQTFRVSNALRNVYYTIQIDTSQQISTSNTIISFTTNCNDCPVFVSLSEPNPTNVNTAASIRQHYFYAPGFLGDDTSSVTGVFNTFNIPPLLSFSLKNTLGADPIATIG
ncbi:unnamed protein product [Rotaria sordida]|uniref:VWFA domain-containing protein n=1 Tax=Rotaria sordida TaxID=392033 RepID=A0A814KSN4_9BILA|nr:unnamed protein product [Rotaria sordida]CAF1055916.1 unnamed protein product [Rotaria sordida]